MLGIPSLFVKIIFKVVSKILVAAAGEAVVEYCVFWLLKELAEHTKTSFDDELLERIRAGYELKKQGVEKNT